MSIIDNAMKTMEILDYKYGILRIFGYSLNALMESIRQSLSSDKKVVQHDYEKLWPEKEHLHNNKWHKFAPLTITLYPFSSVVFLFMIYVWVSEKV
jgi:hypothetical protein